MQCVVGASDHDLIRVEVQATNGTAVGGHAGKVSTLEGHPLLFWNKLNLDCTHFETRNGNLYTVSPVLGVQAEPIELVEPAYRARSHAFD